MFMQMVRLWAAIPIVMLLLALTVVSLEFLWRVVYENFTVVSIIIGIVSVAGLIASIYNLKRLS